MTDQLQAQIIAALREAREDERESTGTSWPDPTDGAPMVGTGHCHYTCLEYAGPDAVVHAGGWFRHPDGFDYEHSWMLDPKTGVIYDGTADQWHLEGFPDVAVIAPGDERYAHYIPGTENLDEDDCLDIDCPWLPAQGFTPVAPPAPPLRGTHLTDEQRAAMTAAVR